MTALPRHSVAVAGIVIDDQGRALLIRRPENGRWEPPGGVLELEETFADGVRREVKEETGLDVEPEALTGIYKNMARGIVALAFRCRLLGGTLTTNPEADAFRWASPDEVATLTNEVFAYRILDAYRDDPTPALRDHDGVNLIRSSEGSGAGAHERSQADA
ncbi:NUDIX hydrolase [Actinomadura fibrosa]|uniref:NUDIX hydrolase n=1 Tax=Actinomadura fibrosa TaxID=111802 RepID=A0ABW2XV85_9ACTN|nr:NUDIX hydrolase [Actinomadura fibrosa]